MDTIENVIIEFTKVHVVFFKTLKRNFFYKNYQRSFEEMIYKHDGHTYKEVLDFYKETNENLLINDMILNLEKRIDLIADFYFGLHGANFTSENYRINAIFYRSIVDIIAYDINIKIATDITGISETTIKQACQQGRLINTYKVGKIWIVNLKEMSEYWGFDIQI